MVKLIKQKEKQRVTLLDYFDNKMYVAKDHPFVDGCKRIAAGLFLLYLSKNALLNKSKLVISSGALTALTLLVAKSDPKEKEIMVRVVMNILFNKM